jgi:hypothetical protein
MMRNMNVTEVDRLLRDLAGRQHAVVGRKQARQAGVSWDAWRRRLASTDWESLGPRVMRLAGVPPSFRQLCMAATLDAGGGAVVSHRAAARLWGLPGFEREDVEVSRLRGLTPRQHELTAPHGPGFLPGRHLTVIDGIPVTRVPRTLFDLAGVVHPRRAERALDNAVARKLVTVADVSRITSETVNHGRDDSAVMRELLAARGVDHVPPDSGLEARFLDLLAGWGIHEPDCQVDLGLEAWVGRVDFLYRDIGLVIEVDSDRYHSSKLDREADQRRDAALRAAGWDVSRIDEAMLRDRPGEVIALIRAARASRARAA